MAIKKHITPAAVALKYVQNKDAAPWVSAKGKGLLAKKMLEIADQKGIPILKNEALLEALMAIEIEKPIPTEAFEAVAEIYAFIIKLDKEYAKNVH